MCYDAEYLDEWSAEETLETICAVVDQTRLTDTRPSRIQVSPEAEMTMLAGERYCQLREARLSLMRVTPGQNLSPHIDPTTVPEMEKASNIGPEPKECPMTLTNSAVRQSQLEVL